MPRSSGGSLGSGGGQSLYGPGVSHKLRSGFNQINDVFSEFTKHIAPAFNHERPERSVQMRLYTMHKGQHLLVFIMFLCLFFIALLMGMAGPRIITEHTETATKLKSHNMSRLPAGPFLILTPKLSSYRQQLWMSAEVITKEKDQETFAKKCSLLIGVEGVQGKTDRTLIGGQKHNRSQVIECNHEKCESFIVVHLGVLEYPRYFINVTFSGLESVDKHFTITDIIFTVLTYNPQFTKMEVWFRFFFVLTSIIVTFAFMYVLRRFPLDDWAIEQKWISLLLPLLINFNDPMFSGTLMSSSLLPAVGDVIMQATFLFSLLLFWLCVFHGLRQTDRGLIRFYLPKVILVFALWFAAITMATLQETNEIRDPTYSYQLNTAHYKNFQLFFIALIALYVVYLLYLSLRAFGELRSMNFLDARLKFHASSMFIVLCLTLSIIVSRYGSGVLEDNFIAKIYTSYDSEGQFLAFYTVLNCYVYVLAYVYSPTTSQAETSHVLKDNPAFSMINESDDEMEAMLIQEEDEPETRRPLHMGHDDESD